MMCGLIDLNTFNEDDEETTPSSFDSPMSSSSFASAPANLAASSPAAETATDEIYDQVSLISNSQIVEQKWREGKTEAEVEEDDIEVAVKLMQPTCFARPSLLLTPTPMEVYLSLSPSLCPTEV